MLTEQGRNTAEIAVAFQERGIARTQKAIIRMCARKGWHMRVQTSPVQLDAPPTMEGDALLLFDIHSPCHDARWINRCVDLALRWGVRQCGIGGDLVDFTAFSIFAKSDAYVVQEEIVQTERILTALESAFDSIIYSAGNHDVRLSRLTGWMLPVETAVRLFMRSGKTIFTRSYWWSLDSGGESFYIEHPRNASVSQTMVPARLAAKYHKHVIAGHGHLQGTGHDVSGRYWAIDAGICADPERLEYYQMQHTIRPAMMPGAVIVKDGIPFALCPQNIAGFEALKPGV
jgi:hypothetical protein